MFTLPENIMCGYWDCSYFENMTVSHKRKVTQFEIEFYLEDAKTTTADNRTYEIKKNHILIAKPGQIRYSEIPFRTLYVKFDASGYVAENLNIIPEYFCSSHPDKIYQEINNIILYNEQDNKLMLQSRILSLINLITTDAKIPQRYSGKNYAVISRAKRYIESNFEKPIKLKDIAKSVHLSETYFHNIFTESVGISPHQYLINVRIENAKKLLWNADIPICEIAEKSGFGCQQYLNKIFKKETKLTPASYRKMCRENYVL